MEAARPPLDATAGGRRMGLTPILIVLLTLVLLAGVGYAVYDRYLSRPAIPPISGTRVAVQRGSVQSAVVATGSVVSTRQSKLALQVSGRLKELPVKLGDTVKAGAVLARIDTAPLDLRLSQAKSNLRTAQVKLEQVKSGPRAEEVAQAEAAVQSAQGKLTDVQSGSLPQEIAQAQAQAENASAQIRAAQARLDSLRNGATAADVSAAEQSFKAAQAQAEKATADLARATAPQEEELAPLRIQVEKAQAAVRQARANFDKVGWRPDIAARPESVALAAATADLDTAQAQLRLKQTPRQTDVDAAQRAVDAARAQMQSAQARIDQLKAGPTAEDVRAAQAAVEAAQATYQQASARVAALQAGAKPGEIQAAQALVSQAQQQLALKRQPTTPQDVALADEQVNAAQLAVQQVQLDIDNATLVAPYDGVVGSLNANLGEQVTAATTILTLIDPKSTRVDVTVDEADIAKIQPGKAALITFDAMPGKPFAGKVVGLAPGATVMQGVPTYVVSIGVEDPAFFTAAPPGLTANASIVVAEKQNVLVVPSRAIKRTGRDTFVDVVAGERTAPRVVKTGLSDGKIVEVTEGLTESDMVVIPGSATVAASPAGAAIGGPPLPPGAPPAPKPPGKP
jgi:HlyD family secretion protein